MIVAAPLPKYLSSLWEATSPPMPALPVLRDHLRADVTIVGGGHAGLTTAIHLAEHGCDVVILEAAPAIGLGASGLSGGQVNPGFKYDPDEIEAVYGPKRSPYLLEFAGGAAKASFDLIARLSIDCDAIQRGFVQPALERRSLAILERRCDQWQRRGAPVQLLDAHAMAALIGTDRYIGGWVDGRGGTVHPLKYTRGLLVAALARGVRVFVASRAQSFDHHGGHWQTLTTEGSVTSDSLAILTNAYSDGACPGLARSYVPVRSFQLATRPLPEAIAQTVMPGGYGASDMRRLLLYWRRDPDNRLLIGGRSSFNVPRSTRNFDPLERMLRHLYPQIGNVEIEHRWYGYVAMTTDYVPHFYNLGKNALALVGCNGRGVALFSALGEPIARWLQGGQDDVLPLPIVDRIKTVPFHRFHTLGLAALTTYFRMRDWID